MPKSINIHTFHKKFQSEYNFLYDHNNRVAGYDEAVDAFDEAMKADWFKSFVGEYVRYRGDFLSSDRECAAFMFALDSLTDPEGGFAPCS